MSVPPIAGVHHLKFPVSDLARSREWYESVLGLRVEAEFRDDDGVVRGVAGALTDASGAVVLGLALRQNPEVSAGMAGFDLVCLSLAEHADLWRWADHVAALGHERPVINENHDPAVLRLHDPDGHEIRLFGPTTDRDTDRVG
jgi:catechol 2,3-dioxygenase-like lactoylglutathione lyase family enzyme